MMRLSIALLLVATPALAQPYPGTGGDPIRTMMVEPSVVSTELPVVAIHGGNPEDTVLLFDGFELPWAFHENAVRSLAPPDSVVIDLMPSAFGVEYGRGSSIVSLTSGDDRRALFAEVDPVDLVLHTGQRGLTASVAIGWNDALEGLRDTRATGFISAIARSQLRITSKWALVLSGIYASEGEQRYVTRPVAAVHYRSERWHAVLAASYLHQDEPTVDRDAIDTRAELIRFADAAAGLTKLEWRLGQQTNSNRYAFPGDTFWRHDVGVWTSIAANLAPRIRATVGLRVDNFDDDVATQPRAALLGQPHSKLTLALAAGAYRRPPEQLYEVQHDLNPERATHVAAGALFDNKRDLWINTVAYYIDRRRLVVRDIEGKLSNSGSGTSLGVDVGAGYRKGPWLAKLSLALTRSVRFDHPRGAERPAPYEQPFRLDVIGGWRKNRLKLGARLQLASGLPFTPYDGAVYNSDADTYEPLYVPPLSARAPFHHQIDLRVDYRFFRRGGFELEGFVDLHNAYRNEDAIAYRYSFDYRERTAITALPLFPFAGLRGSL